MLLVIDVGNTSIVFGVYKGKELIHDFRLSSIKTRTSDEYGMIFHNMLNYRHINGKEIRDVIISCVVPDLIHTLSNMVIKYFNKVPIVVTSDIKTKLNIKYKDPSKLGSDRIVTSVAALEIYGGPCIVVDIGTAMTFCVLDGHRNYLGGLILPGIGISAQALSNMTSQLPKIEIIYPKQIVSQDTVSSMQSGLFHGFTSMIDGITDKILEEQEMKLEEVNLIATGGFAKMIVSHCKHDYIIDRNLTLEGLRILYDMNN